MPASASTLASPGRPLQLLLWCPSAACFGLNSGIPRLSPLASTPASPSCPLWLPLQRPQGAHISFHFGVPRMPASKLSPPPVSFLTFAGQLPAPQWLQGDSSGGVKIGVEMNPKASFQDSFQLPLGARFSFHLGVPRPPALASTLMSPGCPLQHPLPHPLGTRFGFHFGIPRGPLWLLLWLPPGACFGFHLGIPRGPASALTRGFQAMVKWLDCSAQGWVF